MPKDDSDELMDSVIASMQEDARKQREKDFASWCDELAQLPGDFELKLKDGFEVDLELQPFRSMDLGLDLLQSSKGTVSVSGGDERPGLFLDSYLAFSSCHQGASNDAYAVSACPREERESTIGSPSPAGFVA